MKIKEKANWKAPLAIRVDPWLKRVLKHDARTRKITVSNYTLQVIKRGLGVDHNKEGQNGNESV